MSRRLFQIVTAAGFIFALSSPLALAKKRTGKPGDYIQVVSVDISSNKVTVADGAGKDTTTYDVTPLTKITVNRQPAKLSDLTRGMHVILTLAGGGKTADKIDATSAPADSSPPKKKAN